MLRRPSLPLLSGLDVPGEWHKVQLMSSTADLGIPVDLGPAMPNTYEFLRRSQCEMPELCMQMNYCMEFLREGTSEEGSPLHTMLTLLRLLA